MVRKKRAQRAAAEAAAVNASTPGSDDLSWIDGAADVAADGGEADAVTAGSAGPEEATAEAVVISPAKVAESAPEAEMPDDVDAAEVNAPAGEDADADAEPEAEAEAADGELVPGDADAVDSDATDAEVNDAGPTDVAPADGDLPSDDSVGQAQPEPAPGAAPQADASPEPESDVVEAPVAATDLLADLVGGRPVLHSRRSFTGRVWDITTDLVNLGEAGVHGRDYVHHTGAVAVFALNEDGDIYLVRQYRHPVRAETWEPPAGLLDIPGEAPVVAAQRELHEEADLVAERWDVLADFYSSPGGSSEAIRIYLARDVADAPEDGRHERTAEEADMEGRWVPLADILAGVAAGTVHGPTLIIGALALDAAIRSDWATLRPADAAWRRPPARGEL